MAYLKLNNKLNDVVDFESFIEEMKACILGYIGTFCLTKSCYVKSKNVPNNISGLVLEFDMPGMDVNDIQKKIDFFNDPLFDIYRINCSRYGFKIDFQIPWRIISDIRSSGTQAYMKLVGESRETLFENRFYKGYLNEFEDFKTLITGFYRTFISSYPKFADSKTEQIVYRTPLDKDSNIGYNDVWWLRFYCFVKYMERNKKYNLDEINLLTSDAVSLYNLQGLNETLTMINEKTLILANS
jgi:hypothetical protein